MKNYRVELRVDTQADTDEAARQDAARIASLHPGGEVTAIFNEEWDEI